MNYQKIKSPIGDLYLVADGENLFGVLHKSQWTKIPRRKDWQNLSSPVLRQTEKQLRQYFDGQRKRFELPLKLEGTDFQKRTWSALMEIPYGETRTYKEQALQIQKPAAVRAVGAANGKNRLSIILPCHRVIGASGALTGYAGGLKAKKFLLALEKQVV